MLQRKLTQYFSPPHKECNWSRGGSQKSNINDHGVSGKMSYEWKMKNSEIYFFRIQLVINVCWDWIHVCE